MGHFLYGIQVDHGFRRGAIETVRTRLFFLIFIRQFRQNGTKDPTHYLKPKILEHFSLKSWKMTPLDYDRLIRDQDFKQSLYWALNNDSFLLDAYRKIKKKGKRIQGNIQQEIERLE